MTEAEQNASRLLVLRATVRRLAAPSEDQLTYLAGIGDARAVDELALEFDAVAPAALAEAGLLTDQQIRAVMALDDQLASMSGASNAELWTVEAVAAAPEWDAVRHLAHDASVCLGA